MNEPDFAGRPASLRDARIGVVGLGLMGGSLALGLAGSCRALFGIDSDPSVVAEAQDLGVFQQVSTDPAALLPRTNLVFLAVPVLALLELISQLPALHPGQATVIDIGSTKVQIADRLAVLPPRFRAVGGHPMCGKEWSGLAHADAVLFQGFPFIFTQLANTDAATTSLAEEVASVLGARSVWLDSETHDALVAATSHVPYFLASALVAATPASGKQVYGPGFRSASRLAASSSDMMTDIIRTNRRFILEALDRLQTELSRLQALVRSEDDQALREALAQARQVYLNLLSPGEM